MNNLQSLDDLAEEIEKLGEELTCCRCGTNRLHPNRFSCPYEPEDPNQD